MPTTGIHFMCTPSKYEATGCSVNFSCLILVYTLGGRKKEGESKGMLTYSEILTTLSLWYSGIYFLNELHFVHWPYRFGIRSSDTYPNTWPYNSGSQTLPREFGTNEVLVAGGSTKATWSPGSWCCQVSSLPESSIVLWGKPCEAGSLVNASLGLPNPGNS